MKKPSKRINRSMDRRKLRRVLNGSMDFFKTAGHGNTIKKGYGGGITKGNLLDRSVEA